ncbi:transcription factor bHLH51 [Malania oleifera]|uniref:transcription factor bHLH51 n=1 Tax=Malania oleifera TaxID=397392 RepID=UPI0025AE6796|nr:transcription factor bHLH51 [Malania oleifera]
MANCFFPEEGNWAAALRSDTVLVPWPVSANASSPTFQVPGFPPWLPMVTPMNSPQLEGLAEDRAASASKSHSQAEKRRRDRINAQLATLRKLIPKSEKMDKAALLGSAIDHVKELKRKATEASKSFIVPTEVDEVIINDCDCDHQDLDEGKEGMFIKASVCCDDRPELFGEFVGALKGLRLTLVRADIASLGGRVKSILVVSSEHREEGVSIASVKESLRVVLTRIAASSAASICRFTSKRQRFFLPSHVKGG